MEWYKEPLEQKVYIRYAKMALSEIPITLGDTMTFQNGMHVSTKSPRMRLLWERKNLICKVCGIAAAFAALESHKDTPEAVKLNFYSYDHLNNEVMLTWDHIVPRAEAGGNEDTNAQCLCSICNGIKAAEDFKPSSIQGQRKEKGLPIRYTYLADGSRIFQWSKKQWSTELSGSANT